MPLSLLLLFLVSLGLACLTAVATVYFRDVQHFINVLVRAWFYLTPIIIPFEHIPAKFRPFALLNPMYYILEMFDAPIARCAWPAAEVILFAALVAVGSCVVGLAVFYRYEDDLVFHL